MYLLQNTLTDDYKIFVNRMFPNNSNMSIVFEEVQYQTNPYDCRVFVIAFTVAIIYNYCPCGLIIFDISKMRDHLLSIYETSTLMMFPLERNNYKTTEINFTVIPSNRQLIHYKQIHEESLNFQDIDFNNLEQLKHNERMTQETSLINLYKNQSNNKL